MPGKGHERRELTLRVAADRRFSRLDTAGTTGGVNLGFRATLAGTECPAALRGMERVGEQGFDLTLGYAPFPVEEQVRICWLWDLEAVTVERVFRNCGRQLHQGTGYSALGIQDSSAGMTD
jgi:hypothetical protein